MPGDANAEKEEEFTEAANNSGNSRRLAAKFSRCLRLAILSDSLDLHSKTWAY
jgi:hypothetical protein